VGATVLLQAGLRPGGPASGRKVVVSRLAETPSRPHAPPIEPPTDAADYALLNAVYGSLLAAVAFAVRERAAGGDPIASAELLPMGAATFALSKMIARERIGTWVREPFVHGDTRQPRGRGVRRAVGELVTCTRCVGAWSGLAIVGLRVASPAVGRTVTSVLATSAVNDFMQAGFRLLCNRVDAASR
jgi:hypothetical protein